MEKFPPNQKQPNVKQKSVTKAPHQKTPRVKLHPVGFPTHEGDLGVLRINPQAIPKMTRAPSKTQDGTSHAMANVMKKSGMLY